MADTSLPLPTTLHSIPGRIRNIGSSYASILTYISASLFATQLMTLLITKTEFKFPFPYICDCLELGLAWLVLSPFVSRLSKKRPTSPPYHHHERNLWLMALAQAATLIVQPLFLTHVPIGSFQSFSALALPIAMAMSYRLGIDVETSWIGVGVYVAGMWLLDRTQISWGGSIYGLIYAAALALYSVQLKRCLVHSDVWTVIQQSSIRACLGSMLAVLLSGEWRGPIPTFIDEAGFWFQWVLSGLLGLGVNVLGAMLVEETSPAIFLLASGCKACLQILVAAALFGNLLSFKSAIGTALALAGAVLACFIPSIAQKTMMLRASIA